MIEIIIGGIIGWAISVFMNAIILAIVAWAMAEVATKVANYLREKRREFSILA